MVDQLIGLLLLGLGFRSHPLVKGDTTEVQQTEPTHAPEPTKLPSTNSGQDSQGEHRVGKDGFRAGTASAGVLRDDKRQLRGDIHSLKVDVSQFSAEKRVEFEQEIDEKRKEALSRMKVAHDEFKRKLATIKDTQKQTLVSKIDSHVADIEAKRTAKMTEHLTKMNEILEKIATRTASAKADGKDTTPVENAIAAAKTAIADAQAAVVAQAAKSYVITFTSEAGLKGGVGSTMKTLEADLRITNEKVIAARKAVSNAIRALEVLIGPPVTTPVSTPVATSTPTL